MDAASDEVKLMEARERAKWRTVAEGEKVREQWRKARESIDGIVATYEGNPEDPSSTSLIVVATMLMLTSLAEQLKSSLDKIAELKQGVAELEGEKEEAKTDGG